jgi:hypothetical protein
VLPHRERYFRGVLHVEPVIPRGQPVAQAAMRISDEHDVVLTTYAGDGHRSRTKTSVVAASCIELKLQASGGLHAISVSPGIDAGNLSRGLYPAAGGPVDVWFVALGARSPLSLRWIGGSKQKSGRTPSATWTTLYV